jgi:hypothetical protein
MIEGVNSNLMFWYIVRTFVNATVYPHPTQQLKDWKGNGKTVLVFQTCYFCGKSYEKFEKKKQNKI